MKPGDIEVNTNGTSTPDAKQPTSWAAVAAAVFSCLAMVFAIAALAAVMGQGTPDCNCGGMTSSIASSPSSPASLTCPSIPAAAVAGSSEGVVFAYNNNGLEFPHAESRFAGLASQLVPIGTITELLLEASDAGDNLEFLVDGKSGDVDFPYGDFKTLVTIGEYDSRSGYMPPGVPDGQGVYLPDLQTLRLVFQSESYGHLAGRAPTWYMPVNGGAANFTGSHVSYIDYNRAVLKQALSDGGSVASAVKGAGDLIQNVINLAGNPVDAASPANVHYGDTGANGVFVTLADITDVWTYHSLCSAHLEEAEQWGEGLGIADSMFLTVEEWTDLDPALVAANGFVGLSAHAIDMATKTAYAVGAFGLGGYEKIVEFNCGTPGYVCFGISGYNGAFGSGSHDAMVARRQAISATRSDGTDWVFPQNIVPARIYVGLKGFDVNGVACDVSCSFLARNGMAYGKVYGFSVPSDTPDRDEWHKGNDRAQSPDQVAGVFAPTAWQWDGTVQDFEYDQAWEFQEAPMFLDGSNYKFWNAAGRDTAGKKTEHATPDPRGNYRYMQGSTAGYMGIYDLTAGNAEDSRSIADVLGGLSAGQLPDYIPAGYELVEGETKISDRIDLGGKGIRADGGDQTLMNDGKAEYDTFEDIDGLEWFAAANGEDYIVIQEDGGNIYGERIFLYKLPAPGVLPTYYFLAMAGGKANTRAMANVCIPALTSDGVSSAEFSGASDMSGVLIQETLGGYARRQAETTVPINDKYLAFGLQFGLCDVGLIDAFGLDRGGQIYSFKPNLP